MEIASFPSLREKRFFPENDVTMTSQVRATYLKSNFAVLRIRGCPHWLSSSMRSWVIVVHNFKSHGRGSRGP